MNVPDKLAPVYLAFQLEALASDGKSVPLSPFGGAPHYAIPVGLAKGDPLKYGTAPTPTAR